MCQQLTKSDTWIKNDLSSYNAMGHRVTDSLLEKIGDLADHIVVAGGLLHCTRRTVHMHQDDSGSRSGDHIDHGGGASESRAICPQNPPRRKGRTCKSRP